MTSPRTAAEWAEQVLASITMTPQASWGEDETEFAAKYSSVEQLRSLIVQALDAYARQQVEAFRERLMPFVIHRASCPQAGRNYLPDSFFDADIDKCTCGLAAVIRELPL